MDNSDSHPAVCLQKTFFENLRRQQQDALFCDAILYAEGEGIPVHRCVLAAFSPFFLQQFSSHDARSHRVPLELPGLKAATLKTLVQFMYTAEMPLPQEERERFLQAARRFCILGFTGEPGTSPVAEPRGSGMPPGAVPQGERVPPQPDPGGSVTPTPPRDSLKTPELPGQRRTPVVDWKPKAPAAPDSSSSSTSRLQRSRGKCANPPANLPASSLVVSWRRMKVSHPPASSDPPCPRRPWRQRQEGPGGDSTLPASPGATAQCCRPPPQSSPAPGPEGSRCPLPGTPQDPRSADQPSGLQTRPRDIGQERGAVERPGQSSVSCGGEEEGGEASGSPAEGGHGDSSGTLQSSKELTFSPAPARDSEETSPDLPLWERRQDQARTEPAPICSPQRGAAWDTRQTEAQGTSRPEERHREVRGLADQRGKSPCEGGLQPGGRPALEQRLLRPAVLPGSAGPGLQPGERGDTKGSGAPGGKRSSCQGLPCDKPLGVKLQKVTHSREWVVVPMLEKREPDPTPVRGQEPGAAGPAPREGGQARMVDVPPAGSQSRSAREEQGLATPWRAVNDPNPSTTDSVESDQRPESPRGDQRPTGLGLGVEQRPEGLGLGVEQRPEGLGVEQSTGEQGLGVNQRPAGLGLRVEQSPGEQGLGVEQRAAGLGLGVDQGLEEGQKAESLSLSDSDLRGDRSPEALAPSGMPCPSPSGPDSSPTSGPRQSGAAGAAMFPREPRFQGTANADYPVHRPDQWGLALPRVTSHPGASPPIDEWGFGWLRVRGQGPTANPWEAARLGFTGQHRRADQAAGSSPSSEDSEVDVGEGGEAPLPLVTTRPEASPPASPLLECTEIDVVG